MSEVSYIKNKKGGRNGRNGGGGGGGGLQQETMTQTQADRARTKGLLSASFSSPLSFLPFFLPRLTRSPSAVLSDSQKRIFDTLSSFITANLSPLSPTAQTQFPNTLAARDQRFLSDLAEKLRLYVTYDQFNEEGENLVTIRFDEGLIKLAQEEAEDDEEEEISEESEEGESSSEAEEIGIVRLSLKDGSVQHPRRASKPVKHDKEEEDVPEWQVALKRVLSKYEKAEVVKELTAEEAEEEQEKEIQVKMAQWKRDYYKVRFSSPPSFPSVPLSLKIELIMSIDVVRAGETRFRHGQGPRSASRPHVSLHRGSAVGVALLLRWCGVVGLVLQLPLCAENDGFVSLTLLPFPSSPMLTLLPSHRSQQGGVVQVRF